MALVASRIQGESSQGQESNGPRAEYWLKSRRLTVKQLFRQMHHNDDAFAKGLAEKIIKDSPGLPVQPLRPMKPLPRILGRELTQQ